MPKEHIATHAQRTPGSQSLIERAEKVTPGGVHHDSRRHGPYPIYFNKAKGPKVWDVDGNAYIDLWMAHYDAILGHASNSIVRAVQTAASSGLHIGVSLEQEVAVAEKIVQLVPSAEQARFCCSGTEATMYAVRLARGFTGRSTIIKITGGWHGASTDLMVNVRPPEFNGAEGAGLPSELAKCTVSAQYNDIDDMKRVMDEAGSDFAGIIMEPVMGAGMLPVDPQFLQFVREETTKRGAVMILDEIITGFRLSLGGAQERFGITPDITTLGKVLGGGMPVGAIAGRADIMHISSGAASVPKSKRVVIGGGTYSCNPLSMAACSSVLTQLEKEQNTVYPAIEEANQRMCDGMAQAFKEVDIPVCITRSGSLSELHFVKEVGMRVGNMADIVNNTSSAQQKEFALRLRNKGVFLFHAMAVSTTHDAQAIEHIIAATKEAAQEMRG